MEVKVLPFRVKSDSLSGHTETNHQSEAGIRAELEANQIATLPLRGRYYGELNVKILKKHPIYRRESGHIPTLPPTNPQQLTMTSCLTLGWCADETETPTVSKQSKERNREKRYKLHKVDNLCGKA
jgi:hypothetical protein